MGCGHRMYLSWCAHFISATEWWDLGQAQRDAWNRIANDVEEKEREREDAYEDGYEDGHAQGYREGIEAP